MEGDIGRGVDLKEIRFDERGLVAAVAQDAVTGEVLMVAWMNAEAVEKTLSSGKAHYYSRSRRRLWLKGETSGNFQYVRSVFYDCDGDTLLLRVDPAGPACHTGERTCFYRTLKDGGGGDGGGGEATSRIIDELYGVVASRKGADAASSYTASLYAGGLARINSKVEEEAAELVEAAAQKGDDQVVHELCDLWFHTLVLLAHRDIAVKRVYDELARRFGTSGIEEKKARKRG
ncbi:MAG TPA: bifunctional phosphoribosyl-AMP cyclohydrolase/phosphoribosyl-ATP diphosphatase HisIE [Deltaproteobacteria bacterium]|nr:bifunctional phosphoribosyl-AMP cyclohydrolase/phosphoribosyl-ATP diphosphatase HisIE [Deltaproteobacteria bacterium]